MNMFSLSNGAIINTNYIVAIQPMTFNDLKAMSLFDFNGLYGIFTPTELKKLGLKDKSTKDSFKLTKEYQDYGYVATKDLNKTIAYKVILGTPDGGMNYNSLFYYIKVDEFERLMKVL